MVTKRPIATFSPRTVRACEPTCQRGIASRTPHEGDARMPSLPVPSPRMKRLERRA